MKPGIQFRLFLAFVSTITLVVVAMVFAVSWGFERGLADYLRQVELERLDKFVNTLSQAYGEHGDWAFLRHNHQAWRRIMDLSRGWPGRTTPDERLPDRHSAQPGPLPSHRPPPWHRPPRDGRPPHPGQAGAHPFGPGAPGRRPPPRRPDDIYRGSPDAPPLSEHSRSEFGDSPPMAPPPPPGLPRAARQPQDPLDPGSRLRLFDTDDILIFGPPRVEGKETRRPIPWQGETVGFLALRSAAIVSDDLALAFQTGQRRNYVLIAVLALLLSALASLVLARRLLRPIRRIATGTQALGAGHYSTRIPVDRSDELGRLAQDFNHLAAALERNEQARRQWVADISHELRTPLAILRGEIEALLDGIRQNSPERMQSLHGEVLTLGKLVDDLYELALSDLGALDYRREPLDLAGIVADTSAGFQHRFADKGLKLFNQVKGPLPLTGDPRRLQQLFTNLLENSQRYTDPGGRLEIRLEASKDGYQLLLEDTPPAVPDQALPQLFARLFRVDKSRSRALGGAGLGLAICRNIVEAHGQTS